MTEKPIVFVYGTLKKNQRANHHLGNARFIGKARTLTVYEMYGEHFPMILRAVDGRPVVGEVYEVEPETMNGLDAYEGYPGFYDRRLIYTMLIDDKNRRLVQAWIYFIPTKGAWVPDRYPIFPNDNGDLVWPPENDFNDPLPF